MSTTSVSHSSLAWQQACDHNEDDGDDNDGDDDDGDDDDGDYSDDDGYVQAAAPPPTQSAAASPPASSEPSFFSLDWFSWWPAGDVLFIIMLYFVFVFVSLCFF